VDPLDHSIREKDDEETEKLYWEILDLQRLQLDDDHRRTRGTV
jgi:hypothetical protein